MLPYLNMNRKLDEGNMKVGDLVRWNQIPPLKRRLGCLPHTLAGEERWDACGMVEEVCKNGNVNVMWPERGFELVDNRFLEVVS